MKKKQVKTQSATVVLVYLRIFDKFTFSRWFFHKIYLIVPKKKLILETKIVFNLVSQKDKYFSKLIR